MARYKREIKKTLLVVGEGDSEKAFLQHLRSLYCTRGDGVKVTIRNAHGKGPDNVVNFAIRQLNVCSYDACVVVLDTDIPWTERLKKKAKKANIELVGSSPCLEGFLLLILGTYPPEQSVQCKKDIKRFLGIDLTEWESYASSFPKTLLEDARLKISQLDRLLRYYEG
ncbi:RloB domain-containing protein [Prosthecochloris sp. CIB 2401]|uniref:RloB domain-containing protein n=1 Tax=Prosthecochloris sp. CIB 2401 TaxID=1868325 RepID=UPI00080ABEA2|nr:RloB domain-containing protein [Prosthecochloris sp. CIB 2401]ANT65127.1 hypothetical protein Ptc2401_01361 [Prosthecochloris sp. CIB 2401]